MRKIECRVKCVCDALKIVRISDPGMNKPTFAPYIFKI